MNQSIIQSLISRNTTAIAAMHAEVADCKAVIKYYRGHTDIDYAYCFMNKINKKLKRLTEIQVALKNELKEMQSCGRSFTEYVISLALNDLTDPNDDYQEPHACPYASGDIAKFCTCSLSQTYQCSQST